MMTTEKAVIEKLKREFPDLVELLETPEADRDAYILAKINEANAEWGDPPVTRLISDEEAFAEFDRIIRPKHVFRRRLKRAWAVLKGDAD